METKSSLLSADLNEIIALTQAISNLAGDTFKDLKGLDVVYSQSTSICSSNKVSNEAFLTVLGYIPSSEDSKMSDFRGKANALAAKYFDVKLNFGIYHGLYKGDTFTKLEELQTLPNKEDTTFAPKEGEVTVVYFWDNNEDHSLHHPAELAQKNSERWGGKVRIVGISIAEDLDKAVEVVKFGNFKGSHQYHAKGGWESKAVKSHGADFLPAVFLVDQKGVVVYRGEGTRLEERVDELLTGETHKFDDTSLSDLRSLHKSFEENHVKNSKLLKNVWKVSLNSRLHLATYSHVHATAEVHEHHTKQDRKSFVEYVHNVIEKLPQYVDVRLNVKI